MTEPVSLRGQLRSMLEQDRLNDGEYGKLKRLIGAAERPSRRLPGVFGRRLVALAAVLALAAAVVLGHVLQTLPGSGLEVPPRVAEEVFTNHVKVSRLDLESASLEQIREHFVRLDFSPITPTLLELDQRLLGARYCTLLGRIAAQLKYHTEDGELITYYQAAYDRQRFGALPALEQRQDPLQVVKHGVLIRVWVEQDIVVAQARTVNAALLPE